MRERAVHFMVWLTVMAFLFALTSFFIVVAVATTDYFFKRYAERPASNFPPAAPVGKTQARGFRVLPSVKRIGSWESPARPAQVEPSACFFSRAVIARTNPSAGFLTEPGVSIQGLSPSRLEEFGPAKQYGASTPTLPADGKFPAIHAS